jgi:hypothetical protein
MSGHDLPPMEQLRENLREAARREMGPALARRRRRRRSVTGALLAVIGLAAAAGAAELISVGEPVPDPKPRADGVRPEPATGAVSATARDPGSSLAWAVKVYDAQGKHCALVGQLRGDALGEVRDGQFRPFTDDTGGACGNLEKIHFFGDLRRFEGTPARSLVFGRASAAVREMRAVNEGRTYRARPGAGGGFLFVFDSTLQRERLRLHAYDAAGRRITR